MGRQNPHCFAILNRFTCQRCVLSSLVPSRLVQNPIFGFLLNSNLRRSRRESSILSPLVSHWTESSICCDFGYFLPRLLAARLLWLVVLLLSFLLDVKSLCNRLATTEKRELSSGARASVNFFKSSERGRCTGNGNVFVRSDVIMPKRRNLHFEQLFEKYMLARPKP